MSPELYDPNEPDRLRARARAKLLLAQYNRTSDEEHGCAPIEIVGGGALVLPGVTIGDRAVVGAGSVVTHDVPPDTVVAGSPARPIRALVEVA